MKFIIDKEKYIETGLVNETSHPTFPYVIYNYSQKCQFAKAWDGITMMCRGLIVHKDTREIIARPFPKFFNYEEHILTKPIPEENPYVLEKMDGSLGILYWHDEQPYIATRGSFTSDQAIWATNWIQNNIAFWNFDIFDDDKTFLFEIIYPRNRIVVNYNFSGLVLLDVLYTESGKRAPLSDDHRHFPRVAEYPFSSYESLKSLNIKNAEGFVLLYPTSELRLKIKFEDYVRLHKVMTGLSQIGIWEMLRDGKDPITPEIPDEMHEWISKVVEELGNSYSEIEDDAINAVELSKSKETRKEKAEIITENTKYTGVAFYMLDNKDYSGAIWKLIRPHGSATFKKDIDA